MELFSYRQAAAAAGCSKAAVHRAVNAGRLKVRRRMGRQGFDPKEVYAWRNERLAARHPERAMTEINDFWARAVASMFATLAKCVRPDYDAEKQIVKDATFDFAADYIEFNDFFESFVALHDQDDRDELSQEWFQEDLDSIKKKGSLTKEIEIKLVIYLRKFISGRLHKLEPSFNNFGFLQKCGKKIELFPRWEFGLDSNEKFYDELIFRKSGKIFERNRGRGPLEHK